MPYGVIEIVITDSGNGLAPVLHQPQHEPMITNY